MTLTRKKPQEVLLRQMTEARTFGEWRSAGMQLDSLLGNDIWYPCLLPQPRTLSQY